MSGLGVQVSKCLSRTEGSYIKVFRLGSDFVVVSLKCGYWYVLTESQAESIPDASWTWRSVMIVIDLLIH